MKTINFPGAQFKSAEGEPCGLVLFENSKLVRVKKIIFSKPELDFIRKNKFLYMYDTGLSESALGFKNPLETKERGISRIFPEDVDVQNHTYEGMEVVILINRKSVHPKSQVHEIMLVINQEFVQKGNVPKSLMSEEGFIDKILSEAWKLYESQFRNSEETSEDSQDSKSE